jgi:hypothetical protein
LRWQCKEERVRQELLLLGYGDMSGTPRGKGTFAVGSRYSKTSEDH